MGVGSSEGKAVFQFPFLCRNESTSNTVGGVGGITSRDTVIGATIWYFHPGMNFFDEVVTDRSSGHADGAFDDDDVLRLGVDIRLLEPFVGVAFVGGYKSCPHLDTTCPHIEE